ncbi:hypothetical protein ACJX0J_041213, partial [Zea mays]
KLILFTIVTTWKEIARSGRHVIRTSQSGAATMIMFHVDDNYKIFKRIHESLACAANKNKRSSLLIKLPYCHIDTIPVVPNI